MKLLIVGPEGKKDIRTKDEIHDLCQSLNIKPSMLISNGRGNAVFWAENYFGYKYDIPIEHMYPNFKMYRERSIGKNDDKMMFECDAVLAFDDGSKRVHGMIKYALYQKKNTTIIKVKKVTKADEQLDRTG